MPTPKASDGDHGGPNQRDSKGKYMLPGAVVHLMGTPMASSGAGPGDLSNYKNRTRLETQVQLLKTPTTNLGSNGGSQAPSKRREGGHGPTLADEIEHSQGWRCEDGRDFGPAVLRWESLTRPAPSPTEPSRGKTGKRLAPPFMEWMMGLAEGHVTSQEIGLTRPEQCHVIGNGVVPMQAAAAFAYLMDLTESGTEVIFLADGTESRMDIPGDSLRFASGGEVRDHVAILAGLGLGPDDVDVLSVRHYGFHN
jgi:DNA (cytosine-5)-methyltransferase 1